MRRGRVSLIAVLFLLVLLLGGMCWQVHTTVRQERLDHALIAAIKKNDTKLALALVAEGADPNASDDPPQHISLWRLLLGRLRGKQPAPSTAPTALLLALEWRPIEKHILTLLSRPCTDPILLQTLLDHGADPNVVDAYGDTPLLLATFRASFGTDGCNGIIKLLIEHGADVNHSDGHRMSPFMNAVTNPAISEDVIQTMLAKGANVNDQRYFKLTPLMLAVKFSRPDFVKLLLAHHADVNVKDEDGETVLAQIGHPSYNPRNPESIQIYRTDLKIIQMLKHAGAKE